MPINPNPSLATLPLGARLTELSMRAQLTALVFLLALSVPAWSQQTELDPPVPHQSEQPPPRSRAKAQRSPGGEIGSGAGNIGMGAAKGAGSLAKGAGSGALDLVTLHPINAAASVGRGAVGAGKDVGVGTLKGTGKMLHGTGRAIKKIF